MSRTREIERRLGQLSSQSDDLLTSVETAELWPRFEKVRHAILIALTSEKPQAQRELSTFSWSGVDEGIHDHNGHIEGTVNGIKLDIDIKGTTVDDQPRYVVDSNGQWRLVHSSEHFMEIHGSYTSADGRKGAVRFQVGNAGTPFEAYWLEVADGRLRLEQVAHNKDVFVADSLVNKRDQVTIPGTRIELPRFIEG
ncbi:hypothetical protein COT75_00110 [Candidatus Beckwithbacteria bacterium CG10_big_fil_rev_8_21_14_0_10_34_10]|uniref:Uncharacterized protein n=1 Tax=Candidatus Beckwithbacteria bacterium CG10_big_fil_rev_8_21_14_0_10_34_10 TaxID=1974495 RepID=A0A2H0WAC9_9BACT|nr:MAG: hypothetical protein COT75_00110 [Candidatus Beckwithbacteria bacterium CG10_big_fil_rev_8_21_14_0_10_34_10]